MSILFDNPVQPILKMPADLAQWHHNSGITDAATRWQIYLHQLGLTALMSWFQEEFDRPVCPWPYAAPLDIWHAVNGISLQLGHNRIVVILSEAIDAAEINVPQEWVDLPHWSADYYIAAYVDVDEDRLVLWGYTTHGQLKSQGTYHADERTYGLNDVDMVQDFSVFWVAQQMAQPTAIPADPLPTLSTTVAENLIQHIAKLPEPRLALPFTQWAALFTNGCWRQQLYRQRHGLAPVSIQDWLDNIFEQGWQTIDTLLPQAPAALRFRSAITSTAVLTCGKKILLNTSPDDLLLMFSVDIEANKRRNIRIQLYPSSESLLPSDVVLALELSETGELLKTVKAGSRDNFIQIPPFRCSAGQRLRVHIQLDESTCQEDFIS